MPSNSFNLTRGALLTTGFVVCSTIMSTGPEGFTPRQQAFAEAAEATVEPNQAAIALAMQQRMQPIAEHVQDTLLAYFSARQSQGTLQPGDNITYRLLLTKAGLLDQTPENALATPAVYVGRAANFMNSVIILAPDATADVFNGYTQIVTTDGRWPKQFHDASLTDKWELMVVAALQMAEEGQPRPTTYPNLAQAAYERGLYRR